MIYDEKDLFVSEFFGQLLYNHLGAELEWDLNIPKQEKVQTVKRLFTQDWSFAFFPSARRTGSQIALLAIETPGATRGHRGKWIMS